MFLSYYLEVYIPLRFQSLCSIC